MKFVESGKQIKPGHSKAEGVKPLLSSSIRGLFINLTPAAPLCIEVSNH